MYIFTEEKWDTAVHAFIALHAASIVLNSLFTSCHLIHFYFAALPLCWPHGLSDSHFIFAHLSVMTLWAPGDPRRSDHTSHSPHSRRPVMAPPSKLMVAIIFASCLIVFEKSPTGWWVLAASGHQSLDNEASTTQMRSHLEWIDQDRRLSLIIPPWLTGEWWQSLKIWCLIH